MLAATYEEPLVEFLMMVGMRTKGSVCVVEYKESPPCTLTVTVPSNGCVD